MNLSTFSVGDSPQCVERYLNHLHFSPLTASTLHITYHTPHWSILALNIFFIQPSPSLFLIMSIIHSTVHLSILFTLHFASILIVAYTKLINHGFIHSKTGAWWCGWPQSKAFCSIANLAVRTLLRTMLFGPNEHESLLQQRMDSACVAIRSTTLCTGSNKLISCCSPSCTHIVWAHAYVLNGSSWHYGDASQF